MACPDDNELSEFMAGALTEGHVERIEAHVDGCEQCRGMLVELARILDPDDDGPQEALEGEELRWPGEGYLQGRYVPERVLGAGGMSLVYEGRDVVLQRRVALKVMLNAPEDVRARLRREARALAMLSHPNVVDVYDVDLSRGNAFLACELVPGGSLREWLADAPRDWRTILDVIIDAARGLEAAHAVGLVHRDVTPGNVLIGEDGRGRVADFGLACLPDSRGEVTAREGEVHHRDGPRRTTGWVGTPGYVAPEVQVGRDAGVAADQYSLCVTAFRGSAPAAAERARGTRCGAPRRSPCVGPGTRPRGCEPTPPTASPPWPRSVGRCNVRALAGLRCAGAWPRSRPWGSSP